MKDVRVLNLLVEREVIPSYGTFNVTSTMIDSFYETYREVYPPKTNKKNKGSNVAFARKLAGLSLMKLNIERSLTESVSITKLRTEKPKCGIVYVISNPAFPGFYKVGITKNLPKRLASYQTYDPHRAFKVEHYKFVDDCLAEEKECLNKFKTDLAKGEWVSGELVKTMFGQTL